MLVFNSFAGTELRKVNCVQRVQQKNQIHQKRSQSSVSKVIT